MSTENLSAYNPDEIPSGEKKRVAIIVSEWNSEITFAMRDGAIETLKAFGVKDKHIKVHYVPGSFELIYGAAKLATKFTLDAIIVLGSVIRGETPHFDYISESVMINIGRLNLGGAMGNSAGGVLKPVINGVLTTDNMEQALDRAGGKLGNKGVECAITALKMMNFG